MQVVELGGGQCQLCVCVRVRVHVCVRVCACVCVCARVSVCASGKAWRRAAPVARVRVSICEWHDVECVGVCWSMLK